MSTPRASFSNDSRLVKMSLPKSVLLKDYLLDDLSSCSSNGFRSYPRRQCCTKVRYLIEIDLNKHIKLHPTQQKHVLKSNSKSKSRSKSSSVLQKASATVVDVFRNFQLSKKSFWKRTTDQNNKRFKRLDSFEKPIKRKDVILSPVKNGVTAAVTTAEMKAVTSNSNSNSSISSNSYFTSTSDSSTNVAQDDVVENMNTVNADAKVTTARKTMTLLLSYIIFTKPLTTQHGAGLILIAMGVILKMVPNHKVPGYVQGSGTNIRLQPNRQKSVDLEKKRPLV